MNTVPDGYTANPVYERHRRIMTSRTVVFMMLPAALFDHWNTTLKTGNPGKEVANYAERAILPPTMSGMPQLMPVEKVKYFHHFLGNRCNGFM